MIQTILVFIIVGIAVAYTIRNLYHAFKGKGGCGCGCTGCSSSSDCAGHAQINDSPERRATPMD